MCCGSLRLWLPQGPFFIYNYPIVKPKKAINLEPEDENLPAILSGPESDSILLELPDELHANSTLHESKQADVKIHNALLNAMYAGLGKCTTINSLCKLSAEVRGIVADRRKALCQDYGAPNKSSGPKDFVPLD